MPFACDRSYASVCSVPLATSQVASLKASAEAAADATALTDVWNAVPAPDSNFYASVVAATTGTYVASGNANLVGKSSVDALTTLGITGITGAAFTAALQTAADQPNGNTWATMAYTMNGAAVTATYYVQEATAFNGNKYLVFSSYESKTWAVDVPCTAANDAPCGNVNVNAMLGKSAAALNSASTQATFNNVLTAVTNDASYRVQASATSGRFYTFVFTTAGVCKAHGGNANNVGKTISQILTSLNVDTITGAVRAVLDSICWCLSIVID